MAHTIPNSTGNFSSSLGVPFLAKNNNFLLPCSLRAKLHRKLLPAERYRLCLSTSLKLFPHFQSGCLLQSRRKAFQAYASGTDVAVEESDISQVDVEAAESGESSEKPNVANTSHVKRPKSVRKSDMPPVTNEELVPGATFTGKVRSIQPFGAFVDFGAFTDGLVHVSQLSDSFVKDVANVVSVGQEVKVRLVEANMDTGRISLSMRENDDSSKQQQQKGAPINGDKSRTPKKPTPRNTQKREDVKKSTKFVKGQDLVGTVKNLTRSGAFISLPEGEEGFLPTSEEAVEGYGSMMGDSSLEVDQVVNVRVLRITRGQVTLTMKKEEDAADLASKLNQGVVHKATNPFFLAFRNNKEISSFLDERKIQEEASVKDGDSGLPDDGVITEALEKEELELHSSDSQSENINLESSEEGEVVAFEEVTDDISLSNGKSVAVDSIETDEEEAKEAESTETAKESPDEAPPSELSEEVTPQALSSNSDEEALKDAAPDISGESTEEAALEASSETEEKSQGLDAKAPSVASDITEHPLVIAENEPESTGEPSSESHQEVSELKAEDQPDPTEKSSDAILSTSWSQETPTSDPVESTTESSTPEIDPLPTEALSAESQVDGQEAINGVHSDNALDDGRTLESTAPTEPVSDNIPEAKPAAAAATISPALVKQLREETGAGMMDCKKALSETGGDMVKAQEYLRKKGLASADKKASRVTAEGRIGSYIHDSRIGVLIEVNCETDFVARGDIFKELVEDLAMQVAACPQVEYLSIEDIPTEIVAKEKEIEAQKEDLLSKPEQIRSKIVDGRVSKRLGELALLEQPFIRDDKVLVKDWVKQTISTIGENIKVKRFARYNLGEGLEKKNVDFAAEVAAQTAAKPNLAPSGNPQPEAIESKEAVTTPEKVTVSAALVKKLRDETGAGMMDCKKALSETGGDFDKAQEFLRKKGLSAADKKSSRIAAEGRIASYIHDSRIGVLLEVNCETDFVGRSQAFKEVVDDLAMQAVACPQVEYVSIEDIPSDIVDREKQLEMQREDLQSKPEHIREKIVDGRISKRLGELSLLEQPFIKNDGLLVKDLVKQTVATLGENIKVRRFVRFTLGEAAVAKMEA